MYVLRSVYARVRVAMPFYIDAVSQDYTHVDLVLSPFSPFSPVSYGSHV